MAVFRFGDHQSGQESPECQRHSEFVRQQGDRKADQKDAYHEQFLVFCPGDYVEEFWKKPFVAGVSKSDYPGNFCRKDKEFRCKVDVALSQQVCEEEQRRQQQVLENKNTHNCSAVV